MLTVNAHHVKCLGARLKLVEKSIFVAAYEYTISARPLTHCELKLTTPARPHVVACETSPVSLAEVEADAA